MSREVKIMPMSAWTQLAHVSDELHAAWCKGLADHGVHVDPRPVKPAGS